MNRHGSPASTAGIVTPKLNPTQLALRDKVCARARTLHDRLITLADLAWSGTELDDANAVRGWLFAVHEGEPKAARRHSTLDR